MIPHVLDGELFLDTRADRSHDRAYFLVAENLVDACPLDVENFPSERKNRLECSIASLLGRAARAVALYEIDLAKRRIAQ